MECYGVPHTALTMALLVGLYFAIIMDRLVGPHTALTIAFLGGPYLANIMDRYGGPHTSLTIAFAWRLLLNHYNGPLWRPPHIPYHSLCLEASA
jgi:hypothetical protein